MSFGVMVGRLCVGLLIDRFSPQRIQAFILLLAHRNSCSLFCRFSSRRVPRGGPSGIGLGSEADVLPYLLARYFGRRHFSVLYGLTWTAYAVPKRVALIWSDRVNSAKSVGMFL
jgi:hypothetical protein